MTTLDELADKLAITEDRQAQLDLQTRRLIVRHSLVLHRDNASAADVLAMIEHLREAGMPLHATLKVDGPNNHTRVAAHWATEPEGGTA